MADTKIKESELNGRKNSSNLTFSRPGGYLNLAHS